MGFIALKKVRYVRLYYTDGKTKDKNIGMNSFWYKSRRTKFIHTGFWNLQYGEEANDLFSRFI